MENLNVEQVKKGLKICAYTAEEGCDGCPYWDESTYKDTYNDCRTAVCENALALITSQEQRIKEFVNENSELKSQIQETDIPEEDINLFDEFTKLLTEGIREAKADTVRKIADLLWQGESEKLNISVGGKYYDKQEFIDLIAKEIIDGKDN